VGKKGSGTLCGTAHWVATTELLDLSKQCWIRRLNGAATDCGEFVQMTDMVSKALVVILNVKKKK
jgi:hypothetical protein